jgi:hypothetical protein
VAFQVLRQLVEALRQLRELGAQPAPRWWVDPGPAVRFTSAERAEITRLFPSKLASMREPKRAAPPRPVGRRARPTQTRRVSRLDGRAAFRHSDRAVGYPSSGRCTPRRVLMCSPCRPTHPYLQGLRVAAPCESDRIVGQNGRGKPWGRTGIDFSVSSTRSPSRCSSPFRWWRLHAAVGAASRRRPREGRGFRCPIRRSFPRSNKRRSTTLSVDAEGLDRV